ncbi:hypothetical protein MTP03_30800 [Tsukamurella sp. PLM1]|nr:hypothetical protein MTP03_30800 [Tsukamurella sp. PLM1]
MNASAIRRLRHGANRPPRSGPGALGSADGRRSAVTAATTSIGTPINRYGARHPRPFARNAPSGTPRTWPPAYAAAPRETARPRWAGAAYSARYAQIDGAPSAAPSPDSARAATSSASDGAT